MAMDSIRRPALGQYATLGSFYDARNGNFTQQALLTAERPEGVTTTSYLAEKSLDFSTKDGFTQKSNRLGLDPGLGLNVLAGTVELERSGRYLQRSKRNSAVCAYRAVHVLVNTVHETLDFTGDRLYAYLDEAALHQGNATHVVTEVTWGVRASVECFLKVQSKISLEKAQQHLQSQLSDLTKDGYDQRDSGHSYTNGISRDSRIDVTVHSNLQNAGPIHDIEEAKSHIRQILRMVDGEDADKVVPVAYVLMPLGAFAGQLGLRRPARIPVYEFGREEYAQLVALHDQVPEAIYELTMYNRRLKEHKSAISPEHLVKVAEFLQSAHEAEQEFQSSLSACLDATRSNPQRSRGLQPLLDQYTRGGLSPSQILGVMAEYTSKLAFIESITAAGGQYVSSSSMIAEILQTNSTEEAFALFFNLGSMDEASFPANSEFAVQQLTANRTVLLVDCDATNSKLEKSRVSQFQNGKLVLKDVVAEQKRQAELCFIQYDERYVDRSVTNAPAQRKPVKIPCPNDECGRTSRDWICITCHVKVEYAAVDGFIYCDCGRVAFARAAFNCQRASHGTAFTMYPPKRLLTLLGNLPDPPEVNILILGESGVGKSTFINAFINYLTFSSLDQAMSARELNWIIPCSFSTQRFDMHSESEALIEEEVKIGADTDEADGSRGQSATQKATVYPLYMDGKLVRLIDTPGIGDVRGPEQDRKNLANILSVLRNYKDLHGILMLLKPNNARLNVMFKFCVKELLGQLHRSAGRNMVFGFTNTRASNYQPGDTFQPLKTLLNEYSDVIKGLIKETVYCFDSESFRYLAARRQGIDMGHLADYRRSWTHSSGEAHRLVEHFQALQPHRVQQTVSLNETRYLIQQLIQPMTNISTAIFDSVGKSKKQITELENTKATGEDLKKKLVINQTVVISTPLNKPKTVCAHIDCVSYHKDDNGKQITLRKSLCHNPCCLTDVPPDQIGVQQISNCAAFHNGQCQKCPHTWRDHEHIVIEYSVKSETKTDSNVERLLKGNGNEVTAKQAQIKALNKFIDEIQSEHKQIAEAQAKFSHYLKEHSITHWNDATIDYYDHLIKDEKSKAGFGDATSRARLDQLERDKKQYLHFVDAMKSGSGHRFRPLDESGVHKLVETLYSMQHYGKNLKDVADKVGKAYAATFRERPVRLRGHMYWQSRNASNFRPTQLIETKPTRDMQRRTRQFSTEDISSHMSNLSRFKPFRKTPDVDDQDIPPPVRIQTSSHADFGIDHIEEADEEEDEDADEWWDKGSEPGSDAFNNHHAQNGFQNGFAAQQPVPQPEITRKPVRLSKALRQGGQPRQPEHQRMGSQPAYNQFQNGQFNGHPVQPSHYNTNGFQSHNQGVSHGFGGPVPVAANWDGVTTGKRSSWLSSMKDKIKRKSSTATR